jgi:hypothetical protein
MTAMTHPSDPGHPSRPQAPGGPGGPYGPPPGSQQYPGAVPGARPPEHGGPAMGPQHQQQGWAPPPTGPERKGVFGALFDLNFDHMITTKMVKIIYVLALFPISITALLMVAIGWTWLDDGAAFGYVFIFGSPFVWFFSLFVTRICLEFVINQFKISEYLRAIKDKS